MRLARFLNSAVSLSATAVLLVAGADIKFVNWVEQRVHEVQPTKSEKRLDEIGWAKDIRTAEQLAKQHKRPVFLFTHDGKINTGRC